MVEITNVGEMDFKEMDLPENLYKYREWTNPKHKRILTQQELYLASPASFPDQYDCKIPVRYDILTDSDILDYYYESMKKMNPNWDSDKLMSEAKRWADKGLLRDEKRIKELQNEFFQKFSEEYGIVSLTAIRNNHAMWNEYADNHTGFCIGFKAIPLFKSGIFGAGGEVSYFDELPLIKGNDNYERKVNLQIFSKLKKYEYEKEYRLVKIHPQTRSPKVPIEIYSEILLGAKMPNEHKDEIKKIANEKFPNAKIFQGKLRKRKFS